VSDSRSSLQDETIVGIQRGPGSFNEEAAATNLPGVLGLQHYRLEYLHETARVLEALAKGRITFGQFALCNSYGGPYAESLRPLCHARVDLRAQYSIRIRHALIARKDAMLTDLTTILSHDQVFRQCSRSLQERLPRLKLQVGEGRYVDPASVAEALGRGELPVEVATVSNPRLADLHDLRIIESDLQDANDNRSWFVLVKTYGGLQDVG